MEGVRSGISCAGPEMWMVEVEEVPSAVKKIFKENVQVEL